MRYCVAVILVYVGSIAVIAAAISYFHPNQGEDVFVFETIEAGQFDLLAEIQEPDTAVEALRLCIKALHKQRGMFQKHGYIVTGDENKVTIKKKDAPEDYSDLEFSVPIKE